MRPLCIDGRRIPCQICRRRYAVLAWKNGPAICAQCNQAFFIGYMVGRNAEYTALRRKYDLVKKKEGEE